MGTTQVGIEQFYIAVSLLVFVWISDRMLGTYPSPLPPVRQRRRELAEALTLWTIDVALISYLLLSGLYNLPYPQLLITRDISINPPLLTSLILPPVFLRVWRRTPERQALGLGFKIYWKPAALVIIITAIYGIIIFLLRGGYNFPFTLLAWRFVSPSFEEEFLYRGGIQSKLERATSPRVSWFIAGILFGLIHIPTDFFGPIWTYYGQNMITSSGFLLTQIAFGWLMGIFFARSRSLYPCIIGHYLMDFLPDILAYIA